MITFGEIVEKTLRVKFDKKDIEGYSVINGYATYDKNKKLIDASGSIMSVSETEQMPVTCDFNTYRSGDGFKLNISNVAVGNGGEMNAIVETVISELTESYPAE
ncbi:MAG: hypothetical protein ACI4TK_06780 [Agathobacter sp.]